MASQVGLGVRVHHPCGEAALWSGRRQGLWGRGICILKDDWQCRGLPFSLPISSSSSWAPIMWDKGVRGLNGARLIGKAFL